MMIAAVTLIVGPETQPLDPAGLDAGPDQSRLHDVPHLQHRADRGRRRHHARRSGSASSAPAWARRSAPRSTTAAWRNRSASTSTRLFTLTFAFGSGMAALGGGLGAEFLGLDPQYPLKYLVMFLIVVAVGGLGRITGVFYASLIIGVLDFALKKYFPQGGTVFIYAHDDPAAAVAAAGPVRTAGMSADMSVTPVHSDNPAARTLARRHRFQWWETLPWLLALAFYFAVPALSRVRHRAAHHGAVRDLARSRARLCRHRHARPRGVLRRRRLHRRHAGQARKSGPSRSPVCSSPRPSRARSASLSGLVLLRTTGLTLLMLTLCFMGLLEESANMAADITGGFDGLDSLPIKPIFGVFEFNPLYPNTQYLYVLGVSAGLLHLRAHAGLFAVRPQPHRHPREHAAHARGRRAGTDAACRLLCDLGSHRRHRRRALGAGQRLRESQSCSASTAPRRF